MVRRPTRRRSWMGVVETATSHFPTPPPRPPEPPPPLVSHLWWGGACPDVTRGIWWGLSVSQLPRPWRRRRRGVDGARAAIAALVPTSLQCFAEEGRGSFAARHFQRRPSGCALLTRSSPSPSPSPSPRKQLGGPGPGPSRQTATTTTSKEGQRGTSIQAHDGRDTSCFLIAVRQTTSQDPRLESKQAAKSQQGEHCRQLARNQTSRRPRTSAISMPEERDPKQRRSLWLLISDGMGESPSKKKRRAHEFRREPRPRLWNILNRDPSCNLPVMGSSQSFPCVDEEDRGLTKGAA